jgi:hypothetical protein
LANSSFVPGCDGAPYRASSPYLAADPPKFSLEDWFPCSPISLQEPWLSKTIWLTLFCLVGLGPVMAIKVAAPPASSTVGPTQNRSKPDQSRIELAFAPNETAKSDRLELRPPRTEPEIIVPTAKPVPGETPSTTVETSPANAVTSTTGVEPSSTNEETTSSTTVETASSTSVETAVKKAADRHWRNANARLLPVAPAHRHIKSHEPKPSAASQPPSERAEAWHCRQDAMGSLLRSLNLSPRCNL